MEMAAAMSGRLGRHPIWSTLYGIMAILTLIFQVYVRSSQCAPDCALSYAKAVIWASIWPASWIVYIAGIV
jgi:polyferredoxin